MFEALVIAVAFVGAAVLIVAICATVVWTLSDPCYVPDPSTDHVIAADHVKARQLIAQLQAEVACDRSMVRRRHLRLISSR